MNAVFDSQNYDVQPLLICVKVRKTATKNMAEGNGWE